MLDLPRVPERKSLNSVLAELNLTALTPSQTAGISNVYSRVSNLLKAGDYAPGSKEELGLIKDTADKIKPLLPEADRTEERRTEVATALITYAHQNVAADGQGRAINELMRYTGARSLKDLEGHVNNMIRDARKDPNAVEISLDPKKRSQ